MAVSIRRVLTGCFAVLTVLSGVIIFLDGVSVGAIFSKYEQKFSPSDTVRVLILVFGVVFGVSLVGVGATVMFGAWRQNRPALMTATVLLTLVSLAEFFCGVVLFGALVAYGALESSKRDDSYRPKDQTGESYKEQLATRMFAAFKEAYSKVDENGMLVNEKELPSSPDFDQLQTDFQCCGPTGPWDYLFLVGFFPPESCCNSTVADGVKDSPWKRQDHVPWQGQDHAPWQGQDHVPWQGQDHAPWQGQDHVPWQGQDHAPWQRQDHAPWQGQRPKHEKRPGKWPNFCEPYEQGCVAAYFRYWRLTALQFAVLLALLSVVPMLNCVGTTAMLYGLSPRRQPRR